MVSKNTPADLLADYLHCRLKHLDASNSRIEEYMSVEGMTLCRKIDEGVYTANSPAVARIVKHLEYVVGNTFRNTMLVGVCSFLEEAIKAIAKLLIDDDDDYEKKLKSLKGGNWLSKHIELLVNNVGLTVDVSLTSELDKFHQFITLRNCVVHSFGKVSGDRNPTAVLGAVNVLMAIDNGTVEVTKDGFLLFGDQLVPEAIITAENIGDAILGVTTGASMT